MSMDPNAPSCWTCVYQQTGAANLLGSCLWFVKNLNQGAKPIPASVVDKGCEYYEKAPSYPSTPHYHTCRTCPERHRWTCTNKRCVWSLMLDCATAIAASKKETNQ